MREPEPDAPVRIERIGHLNHDNSLAGFLRFLAEVAAWLAIQHAWGWGAVVAAVLALALFNARGDKQVRGILIPGFLRILLELAVMLAGIIAMARWFGVWGGAAMALLVLFQSLAGWRRYRWLLRQ